MKQSGRYDELDSLRGLAASTVVLGHLATVVFLSPPNAIMHPNWVFWRHVIMAINRTPLCVLMLGGPAVRFFFVLSGFVLMLPFLRHRDNPYFPYLVKRICRIYLPYLAAVAVAAMACTWFGQKPLPEFTGTVAAAWQQPVTLHAIVQHVLMLGDFNAGQYDPVLWSLVQEMRISIVFPLLALAVLRFNRWGLVALTAALELATAIVPMVNAHVDQSLQNLVLTPHFASLFVLGAFMAKHREGIAVRMGRLSKTAKAVLAGTAFLAYSLGIKFLWGQDFQLLVMHRIEQTQAITSHVSSGVLNYALLWTGDWITGLSAAVAICFALTDRRTKAVLNHALVLKTGRASYSLYLVHAVVLFSLLFSLNGTRYLFLLVPLYLTLTIVATAIFYRWIEIPTMRLGRKLADKLSSQPSSQVAQTA
jgi:peptidoglycan/LPS O-acetylase OafA/YrhL